LKSRILAIPIVAVLSGCQTYYIPVESFRSQFSEIDSTSLRNVRTLGPGGLIHEYLANPIDQISCIDKDGNPLKVKNSPSIESRITTEDGKRTIFYFDRFLVRNDTLLGYQSRFIGLPKTIPLDQITKIEVQDGKKDFKYLK
jgi:hypothetical protein